MYISLIVMYQFSELSKAVLEYDFNTLESHLKN